MRSDNCGLIFSLLFLPYMSALDASCSVQQNYPFRQAAATPKIAGTHDDLLMALLLPPRPLSPEVRGSRKLCHCLRISRSCNFITEFFSPVRVSLVARSGLMLVLFTAVGDHFKNRGGTALSNHEAAPSLLLIPLLSSCLQYSKVSAIHL